MDPDPNSRLKKIILFYHNKGFLISLVSGGLSALADLIFLYTFKESMHWSYWWSINIAYTLAVIINFCLQKFWAFRNGSMKNAHWQFIGFIFIGALNVAANILIIYLLTHLLSLWYILAQAISTGCLALFNFMAYKKHLFSDSRP